MNSQNSLVWRGAALYCALSILLKLYILLSGKIFTRGGFYYTHAITLGALIPFLFFTIGIYKKRNGSTADFSGRVALRFSFKVLLAVIVVMSAYHYVEFEYGLKDAAVLYYHSESYLSFLKKQSALKPEDYSKIIQNQITSLSAFKAVTSKIFSYLLVGVPTSLMAVFFFKR